MNGLIAQSYVRYKDSQGFSLTQYASVFRHGGASLKMDKHTSVISFLYIYIYIQLSHQYKLLHQTEPSITSGENKSQDEPYSGALTLFLSVSCRSFPTDIFDLSQQVFLSGACLAVGDSHLCFVSQDSQDSPRGSGLSRNNTTRWCEA